MPGGPQRTDACWVQLMHLEFHFDARCKRCMVRIVAEPHWECSAWRIANDTACVTSALAALLVS